MRMNRIRKNAEEGDGITMRLAEATKDNDWGEVAEIINTASKDQVKALAPMIPHLVEHHAWLIRASVVDAIGYAKLRSFADLVKRRLEDKNSIVRSYALMAYYDLLGRDALGVFEGFFLATDVRVRVTALALWYVETGDDAAFGRLAKILRRKGCRWSHCSVVMRIFAHYCPKGPADEVVRLHEEIVNNLPKEIAEEMKKLIAKWKRLKAKRGVH